MTLYVDGNDGSDAGSGTESNPLRTLAEAQRRARTMDPYPSIRVLNAPGAIEGGPATTPPPSGRAPRPARELPAACDDEPLSGGDEDLAASL